MADDRQRAESHREGIKRSTVSIPIAYQGASPVARLLRRLEGLHLFRRVLEDETSRAFLSLLELLATEEATPPARTAILSAYARFFSSLAREVELRKEPLACDPWQDHLLGRLLADENPFSVKAQQMPADAMGPSLVEAARHDLVVLRSLFELDQAAVFGLLRERLGDEAAELVPWEALRPNHDGRTEEPPPLWRMKSALASSASWERELDEIARHFAASGTGIFARYRAFRWVRRDGAGQLEGVANPDPIDLDELIGYDLERALLLQNTEQFVEGFPANNVLLYGDRGTGKSSTVKALLRRYGDRGLRLIEVPKGLLGDFPRILALIRGRRERFVLFVDDLSFDEKETAYKELKAALEGSIEARPDNVVVYATSNRRHLVQEQFADRGNGDGELRRWDTHQEKLSLADRFGITLVFSSPDQARYLRIVEGLAARRGLMSNEASLGSRALAWATQQGGFSGRTARQFVDHLHGELALAARR